MSVTFYYDVGSPYAYLAAERIGDVLTGAVRWRALLLGGLFVAAGRRSWALTPAREEGIAEVESRAAARGLPPITWPQPWPNDGLLAMRVAVAAETLDHGNEYALEAMRLQFREGAPLSDRENVATAARAAGLVPPEVLDLAERRATKDRLRRQTDEALALGVRGVPSVVCPDGRVFWGDDRLEDAAEHIAAIAAR